VTQITGVPAVCWHDALITEAKANPGGSRSQRRHAMHTNLSKLIVLSILALGMGVAAPAMAKNAKHPGSSAYASAERDNSARPGEFRGDRVPEPTYMAIQTKNWDDSN
jgi:hypothetical protein